MLGPSTLAIVDAARGGASPSCGSPSSAAWSNWATASTPAGSRPRDLQDPQPVGRNRPGQRADQRTAGAGRRAGAPRPGDRKSRGSLGRRPGLGLPVVVKPKDGNQGKAVSVNLSTEEQVAQAAASRWSTTTRLSSSATCRGSDFRLLVVNGNWSPPPQRRPAQVVGDGRHNVRELVDMVNDDPRRATATARPDPHPPGRRRRTDPDQARPGPGRACRRPARRCCCATTAT